MKQKKEMLTNNNGFALFVKGLGRNKVDWIVCRIYTLCGYEDFILRIYNAWCQIIHLKSRLYEHYNVLP